MGRFELYKKMQLFIQIQLCGLMVKIDTLMYKDNINKQNIYYKSHYFVNLSEIGLIILIKVEVPRWSGYRPWTLCSILMGLNMSQVDGTVLPGDCFMYGFLLLIRYCLK